MRAKMQLVVASGRSSQAMARTCLEGIQRQEPLMRSRKCLARAPKAQGKLESPSTAVLVEQERTVSVSLGASFGIVVPVSRLRTQSRGIPSFGPSATSTASASWLRQLGPPNLAPLHSQGSVARPLADVARAASTSPGVSGCWSSHAYSDRHPDRRRARSPCLEQ